MKTHLKVATIVLVTAVFAASSACQDSSGNLGGTERVVTDVRPVKNSKIDILFVIDNSLSMQAEQVSLAQWAGTSLFGVLNTEIEALGESPSLHIGIVSSDVGVGSENIGGCAGAGDNGILQNTGRVGNCTPPTDRYIEHIDDGNGNVQANYTGTLGDAFSCIALLGTTGCGFEQHFEAARRSLAGGNPENAGFLRADALLLVVIVADEDDCSASNTGVFDATQTTITDPLGPLTSFRCFEFGVICDGGAIARTAATYSSCEPQEASPFITEVAEFAQFLKALKADPSMVMVTGIFGPADPLTVTVDVQSNFPTVVPSCMTAAGSATPGIRMQGLLDLFPARNRFDSICRPDYDQPLQDTAQLAADVMGQRPCLHNVADLDPGTDGIQHSCNAFDVVDPNTAQESRVQISHCDTGRTPCFRIITDTATCSHTDGALAVEVERQSPAPTGAHLIVECVSN